MRARLLVAGCLAFSLAAPVAAAPVTGEIAVSFRFTGALPSPVPEPKSVALVGVALVALALLRRRKRDTRDK